MQNTLLWIELLFLFVFIPMLYWLVQPPIPKIPVLAVFFFCSLVYMIKNHGFNWGSMNFSPPNKGAELKWIIIRSVLVCIFSLITVAVVNADLLFSFPRQRPWLWLVVMILYPLLSAFPQEFLYRTFLLKRYEPIIPDMTWRLFISVVAFSLLHVIFDNWLAVVLTLPAGWIFTRTYIRTDSLFYASLEHALYGCIVFTTGLGRFFYHPT